jgi:hypothetical protein
MDSRETRLQTHMARQRSILFVAAKQSLTTQSHENQDYEIELPEQSSPIHVEVFVEFGCFKDSPRRKTTWGSLGLFVTSVIGVCDSPEETILIA